jgi:hypothetical protein
MKRDISLNLPAEKGCGPAHVVVAGGYLSHRSDPLRSSFQSLHGISLRRWSGLRDGPGPHEIAALGGLFAAYVTPANTPTRNDWKGTWRSSYSE